MKKRVISLLACAAILVSLGACQDRSGQTAGAEVQPNTTYTVTVDFFDSDVDVSGASALDVWSDFAVAKP